NGGVLATAACLVFQGQFNGAFAAYDSETGEKLWTYDLKAGAAAAPIAYEAGGEQYLAIATGWGTGFSLLMGRVLDEPVPAMLGRVVAFKLDGAGDIQNPDLPAVDATAKAVSFGDAEQLTTGGYYYSRMCGMCHGPSARSSGVLPDLRWSHIAADKELWREVVANGLLKDNGMIAFGERLSEAQIEAIRAYVLFEANPETEAAQ
ncbi:MAG: c-type cytochrome, partial [Amphiplicatus sp.]